MFKKGQFEAEKISNIFYSRLLVGGGGRGGGGIFNYHKQNVTHPRPTLLPVIEELNMRPMLVFFLAPTKPLQSYG
jgi:hypothetical protein